MPPQIENQPLPSQAPQSPKRHPLLLIPLLIILLIAALIGAWFFFVGLNTTPREHWYADDLRVVHTALANVELFLKENNRFPTEEELVGSMGEYSQRWNTGNYGYAYSPLKSTIHIWFDIPDGDTDLSFFSHDADFDSTQEEGWEGDLINGKIENCDKRVPRDCIYDRTITFGQFSGWKTYRNEEYEFTLQYPDNWYVNENICTQEMLKTGCRGDVTISSYKQSNFNPPAGSAVSIYPQGGPGIGGCEDCTLGNISMNGKEIEVYERQEPGRYLILDMGLFVDTPSSWGTCLNSSDVCHGILADSDNENGFKIIKTILSTFKFISTSTVDTSGWKIAGGDAMGFTILIPQTATEELIANPETEPHGDFYVRNSIKNKEDYFELTFNKKGFPMGLNDTWESVKIEIAGTEVVANVQYGDSMNALVYLSSGCGRPSSAECYAFYGQGNKEEGWELLLNVLNSFKKL